MKSVDSNGTDVSFCFNGDTTFDITDVTDVTVVAFDNADREGESTVVEIPGDIDIDSELHFFRYTPIVWNCLLPTYLFMSHALY